MGEHELKMASLGKHSPSDKASTELVLSPWCDVTETTRENSCFYRKV